MIEDVLGRSRKHGVRIVASVNEKITQPSLGLLIARPRLAYPDHSLEADGECLELLTLVGPASLSRECSQGTLLESFSLCLLSHFPKQSPRYMLNIIFRVSGNKGIFRGLTSPNLLFLCSDKDIPPTQVCKPEIWLPS